MLKFGGVIEVASQNVMTTKHMEISKGIGNIHVLQHFSSNIKSLTYWMYQIHFDGSFWHLSIQLSNPILAIDGGIHWETLLTGMFLC